MVVNHHHMNMNKDDANTNREELLRGFEQAIKKKERGKLHVLVHGTRQTFSRVSTPVSEARRWDGTCRTKGSVHGSSPAPASGWLERSYALSHNYFIWLPLFLLTSE